MSQKYGRCHWASRGMCVKNWSVVERRRAISGKKELMENKEQGLVWDGRRTWLG